MSKSTRYTSTSDDERITQPYKRKKVSLNNFEVEYILSNQDSAIKL